MHYMIDDAKLEVYAETAKRRYLVGMLSYDDRQHVFTFAYDMEYLMMKSAIPLGPDLPFFPRVHHGKPGALFNTFQDRIPSRQNPAYEDYCYSQGISPDENNKIILLRTIGRRGPSSFVFEPAYISEDDTAQRLKEFRQKLGLTRWDVARAFNLAEITIAKVEYGQTKEGNILALIDLYLGYPEVALSQLEIFGRRVHADVRTRLYQYFSTLQQKNMQGNPDE